MYEYQAKDSTVTLLEGLYEFRNVTGIERKMQSVRPEARRLMDRHDIVHVVFGLDTSLRQEALVDIWTVFGTTARLSDIVEYLRLPEEQVILSEIGCWKITTTTLRAVPDVGRVLWASRNLKRKWPWSDYAELLDQPLKNIRKEFGVVLLAS